MVFSVDKKKIIASIQNSDRIEKYECKISACENPVCTCGDIDLELIPIQTDGVTKQHLLRRSVEIDIDKRTLGYKNLEQVPGKDLIFAESFLGHLDDYDFQFLYESHFKYKNKISENTPPENIDGYFDYHKVEYDGLMSAYNDILPYGDQFIVAVDGNQCIILDQYCLLPKCPCSDTNLDIISTGNFGKLGKEIFSAELNYRKKQWKLDGGSSFSISLDTVRKAVEEQNPDIYSRMHKRHKKLKAIYTHCKRKNYSSEQGVQVQKVGRNDPCPCGSGKKYKKCCLR
jgi:SEC-C motif